MPRCGNFIASDNQVVTLPTKAVHPTSLDGLLEEAFHFILLVLNVGNGWEWGNGMMKLIVLVDHSRKFPTFSTSKSLPQYLGFHLP